MKNYNKACEAFRSIHNLEHLLSICNWDSAAMMPKGGGEARADALAEGSVLIHQKRNDPKLGELLESAKGENLSEDQQSSLREMSRSYRDAIMVDDGLVKALSKAGSACEQAWRTQKTDNDWKGFEPNFKRVVDLSREMAQVRAEHLGVSAYEAMLEQYEPGMRIDTLDRVFGDLLTWLPDMIEQACARQTDTKPSLGGHFPQKAQRALGQAVMAKIGFDFDHGRLDTSSHPFCGGVPSDVRITTRYDEQDFTSALMGVIHETGHARYEQNLPQAWSGLPVGAARSMAIHESQSLFFEMQMGRNPNFLECMMEDLQKHLGVTQSPASLSTLKSIYARVEKGYIRVDADELTYPIHVILRYQIERDLIEGKIEVADIPERWDLAMKKNLGLSTEGRYDIGCMQDIHWTDGAFGYFPSYTLGALYAAQYQKVIAERVEDFDSLLRSGRFDAIFEELNSMVWSKASLLETEDLVLQGTGETLNPQHFRAHLQRRYLQ